MYESIIVEKIDFAKTAEKINKYFGKNFVPDASDIKKALVVTGVQALRNTHGSDFEKLEWYFKAFRALEILALESGNLLEHKEFVVTIE
ncbi:MAG TPA: hypothetical protein EYG72_01970 [Candidatus Pacebacteria bacterium]|nr:hypothetical protein [Candidatus Paceibacterota bacterium]